MSSNIQKTARDFAIKHTINLGRYDNGYYYVGGTVSMYPTAASAIVLMRKHLSNGVEQ